MKGSPARYTIPWMFRACSCAIVCAVWPGCIDIGLPQPDAGTPTDNPAGSPANQPQSPPHEQIVAEGNFVILRAIDVPGNAGPSTTDVWLQLSGPTVELHNRFTLVSNFIAPQVNGDSLLVFRFIRIEGSADQIQESIVHVLNVPDQTDQSRCDGIVCATGTQCNPSTGTCDAKPGTCDNVVCQHGETCDVSTGECTPVQTCGGHTCGPNQHCNSVTGVCESVCPNITCPEGNQLNPSTCVCAAIDLCKAVNCAPGERCNSETGGCDAVDPCDGVKCTVGEICDSKTGGCVTEGGCIDPPTQAVFVATGSSVGSAEYTLTPDYWVEFDATLDQATFSADLVAVQQAGADNVWGTSDDAVVNTSPLLDCCQRISLSLVPQTGVLLAGRRYRVSLSPGCLRATAADGAKLGLDGEFTGTFPSGDGRFGGAFVQEFIGVAPGEYAGDLVCDEETRDVLGRVTQETKHYDDTIVVDPTGVLVFDGQPIRVGATMSPVLPGFQLEMVVGAVTPQPTGVHVAYDVSGTKDKYLFDGPQEETYTFAADGTIAHAGTSAFNIRGTGGAIVASFTRTCSGTLRQ